MVARRQACLPDAVVGLVPASLDRLHHRLDHVPVLLPDVPARRGHGREQVGDRAEYVELDLPVGRVAHTHGPGAGVAGEGVDHCLGAELEPFEGVERVQALRMAAGALDAAVHPAQERLGLLQRAEVDEHARGHGGIAKPAVAVVPVAHAAELLGQRGRRRGEDRARRPVPQAAQRERAAEHLARRRARKSQARRPLEPRLLRPRPSLVHRIRVGIQAVGVEADLDGHRAAGGGEVDHGPRRVVPAVVEDVPLHARRVERDRLAAAEHEQAVPERLEPDRHLAELRPRRELETRDGAARQDAHEGGAVRRHLVATRPRRPRASRSR